MKSPPAKRNRKVAMEIGVKPSLRTTFTTTNELPQKVIRRSISTKLKGLMPFSAISVSLVFFLINPRAQRFPLVNGTFKANGPIPVTLRASSLENLPLIQCFRDMNERSKIDVETYGMSADLPLTQ
jgi:hypothetical protein